MINLYGMQNGLFGGYGDGVQSNPFLSKRKQKKNPLLMNYIVPREHWQTLFREQIIELLAARFEWSGLPDTIPPYYIEKALITHGHVLLFESDTDGIFAAKGTKSGYNHYEEPTKFSIASPTMNGTFDLATDKCVLVKNNINGTPNNHLVNVYVQLLAEIQTTININLQTMKTPFIIKGTEKVITSLTEQLNQITRGNTHIAVDTELDQFGGIEAFSTPTPYNLDKLTMLLLEIRTQMLESLGIMTNPNPRKKERMLTGEIETNQEETLMNRQTALKMREYAAEQASKLFNTEISVKYSEVNTDAIPDSIGDNGHGIRDNTSMAEQDDFKRGNDEGSD